MPDTEWITATEAFRVADGVYSLSSIYRMADDGRLPAKRVPPKKLLMVSKQALLRILDGEAD